MTDKRIKTIINKIIELKLIPSNKQTQNVKREIQRLQQSLETNTDPNDID